MPAAPGAAFIEREAPASLAGLTVVEVGSLRGGGIDVRDLLVPRAPVAYLGVDIFAGPGVDVVGRAETLTAAVGERSADLVIAAEVLEHLRDWRTALEEMKRALKPGGRLIFTTRSPGYPFHVSPFDYWRYTLDDAGAILADMSDVVVEADPALPGVFAAAVRPADWRPLDLADYRLTCILTGRRERAVRDRWVWRKRLSSPRRVVSFVLPPSLKRRLWSTMPRGVRERLARRPRIGS